MAQLEILHFPDPRLRNRARPVETVNQRIRDLAADMLETMYAAPGIGLAATQVNVPLRVITIDISDDRQSPVVLINPEITDTQGSVNTEEGCLSVPGIYDLVDRAETITYRHLDLDGNLQEAEAQGLLAVCIQHEIDHLEGRLFVDYLSQLKRQRIRKRLEKQQRIAS